MRHHPTNSSVNDVELGLRNKRVLVTGASRGLGAAIAHGFLKEGAKVCIVSRGAQQLYQTEKTLVTEFGADRVISSECDCTNPTSLTTLKVSIRSKWYGLHVVIANVGDGRSVPIPLPNGTQWKKTWDNNFESALHTARKFLPM